MNTSCCDYLKKQSTIIEKRLEELVSAKEKVYPTLDMLCLVEGNDCVLFSLLLQRKCLAPAPWTLLTPPAPLKWSIPIL